MSTFEILALDRAARLESSAEDDYEPNGLMSDLKQSLVNQEAFKTMCMQAFHEVDFNNNGLIDETEFYAGVLLLYHKVNAIPWGGRKKPPKRDTVLRIFDQYVKRQGTKERELDYDSFELICKNHFDQLLESILWRILMITILFPVLAVYISRIILGIPGFERALGSFSSIVPTIIVSALVTILPYAEKVLARSMSRQQRRSLREMRYNVEGTLRALARESEAQLRKMESVYNDVAEGRIVRRLKLSEIPRSLNVMTGSRGLFGRTREQEFEEEELMREELEWDDDDEDRHLHLHDE